MSCTTTSLRAKTFRDGFTLVEVLIAVLILSLALSTVYVSYTGTFRLARNVNEDNEQLMAVQILFSRLESDLGRMAPYMGNFEFRCGFKEIEERKFPVISFRSSNHIALGKGAEGGGISIITFDLEKDNEGVLNVVRRDCPVSKSMTLIKKAVPGFTLCERVKNLSYLFFDSSGKAHETWDSIAGKPEQKGKVPTAIYVRIELEGRDSEAPPLWLSKKFYLPVSMVGR